VDSEKLIIIGFFTFVLPVSWMFASAYFKRWNRRMDREEQLPSGIQADMEQLRSRVLELEERLDFTERLLARQREVERLPGESA
jgi:tetrahydromethanopterin S-methyltransferase subunit G